MQAPGEQSPGEAEGERGLAHPLRPGQQPGVVHPARAQCAQQGGLGGLLADEQRVGAGLGDREALS